MDSSSILSESLRAFVGRIVKSSKFACLQLAGDASTRKYYRIIHDDQSLVLMSWEPFLDSERYPFLNVQSHFASVDVRVPKVVALAPELGAVLLEDLGDLTLERKFWENQNQSLAFPFYQQAVDELIKIHFLASRPPAAGKTKSLCQETAFDTAKFMWEMNYAREHFLEKVGGARLTSDRDQAALQEEFTRICTLIDRQPKFVCHRDYHSRNLMLKLGRVYVIDFQDARLGPLQYDLVSLVHDSYVNLSPDSIVSIKTDYIEKARSAGPTGCIRSDFDDIFRIQVIQRCFKACGSFASFFNARGDTRYLKYLRGTASLVAAMLRDRGSEYKLLLSLFDGHGLAERNYDELCAV